MNATFRSFLLALAIVGLPCVATADETVVASSVAWAAMKTASTGPAQAIGAYSGGCLDGATRLPLRGPGFLVSHPSRGRVFGHPLLVGFIESLGARIAGASLPALAIGDLAQPRGGPAPTGHASHQTGLDVDIAYVLPGAGGTSASIVDGARQRPTARFRAAVVRALELVAAAAQVDRVFVNPVIKRALCAAAGPDRAWLHKIRPWWGHRDHFHVRLSCPADSPLCVGQPPLPAGDGCDELDWWFQKTADRDDEQKRYQARVGASPVLPGPCQALVADPDR